MWFLDQSLITSRGHGLEHSLALDAK